jgi:hypothetical protein
MLQVEVVVPSEVVIELEPPMVGIVDVVVPSEIVVDVEGDYA